MLTHDGNTALVEQGTHQHSSLGLATHLSPAPPPSSGIAPSTLMCGSRSHVIHGQRTMKQHPEGLALSCGMKIVRYVQGIAKFTVAFAPGAGIGGRLRERHVKDRYTVLSKEELPLDMTHPKD